MTYRDNSVYFSPVGGYSLISGSYTIDRFAITDGQDPEKKIKPGYVARCGSDGQMVFSIGRSGSGKLAVGDWFNNQVPISQNTFNLSAGGEDNGDLNFAFLGTLKFTITGSLLGKKQDTFTFQNVALAQGFRSSRNIWWFGGQNCSYIRDSQVIARGTNSSGIDVFFIFLRGSNEASKVMVIPTTLTFQNSTTADWMKKLADSVTLNQIMMPGSHDAGMSELNHCNPKSLGDKYAKTQKGPVGEQLIDGSRYFDIRVDYDHDTLVTYHRTSFFGCNGQPLKTVLDQVRTFLADYPTETAILRISHIRDSSFPTKHDPKITRQKIIELLNDYSKVIYKNSSSGTINLARVKLEDVRGKMILVFAYGNEDGVKCIDPAAGRFRYKKAEKNLAEPGANITVYDEYSDTANYTTMETDQIEKWEQHGGMGRDYLFLLSWTLTPTPPIDASVSTLAKEANSELPDVLYDQIVLKNFSKPNIVYLDFIDAAITQSIIQYNF